MVPYWCHTDATLMPHWCHIGATMVQAGVPVLSHRLALSLVRLGGVQGGLRWFCGRLVLHRPWSFQNCVNLGAKLLSSKSGWFFLVFCWSDGYPKCDRTTIAASGLNFFSYKTQVSIYVSVGLRAARTLLERFRSKSYDFSTHFTHVARHPGTLSIKQ